MINSLKGATLIETVEKEQIKLLAKTLKIPGFSRYESLLRQHDVELSYEKFLLKLMKQELESRDQNRKRKMIRSANFPYLKTLSEFEDDALAHVSSAFINELASCDYIGRRENIIMIGGPGRGKTHLSISLGLKACEAGYHVRFTTASRLAHELAEAQDQKNLLKLSRSLVKADLLIIDEMSYVSFNRHQSELLFQVISERSERGSIITSTNLEFSKWTELFSNEMMLTALIDRLTFRSHILNMNGKTIESERQKRTR